MFSKKQLDIILKVKLILFICLGLITSLALIVIGYEVFVEGLTKIAFSKSLSSYQENLVKVKKLISPIKFYGIITSFFLISLIFSVFYWQKEKISQFLFDFLNYFSIRLKYRFYEFFNSKAKYIIIIPACSVIFFAIIMPVSYDEAITYLAFTDRSILSSVTYYPAPNNHVFHSVLTNFTHLIPGIPDLQAMRIAPAIFYLFSIVLTFSFAKKFINQNAAILLSGLFCVLFMNMYYSYMSRGYGLVIFFFINGLYAAFNIINHENLKWNWLWFCISSILGFFTMPSYLYPFISLELFILFFTYNKLKNIIISGFAIVSSVVLLYTPIILFNGLAALTKNKYVAPISRLDVIHGLPEYFSKTLDELFGFPFWISLIFIGLAGLIILKFVKNKQFSVLYLIGILIPFALLIAHSVIPFTRTFVYYGFFLSLFFSIALSPWIKEWNFSKILFPTIALQFILVVNFYIHVFEYETFNITFHEANEKILAPNKSYFLHSRLYNSNLLFELRTRNIKIGKFTNQYPTKAISADTLINDDYVIIDSPYDSTQTRKPFLVAKDDFYKSETRIYKK